MKTILSTLNAKYIHTSLALRLLYVVNKEKYDISFKEYTIKEDVQKVADELIETGADIIGLGVYIWNVHQTQLLVSLLKQKKPTVILILGGPEVTYEPDYFLDNWEVDYIISGEGEFVLGQLIGDLEQGHSINIDGVSSHQHISKIVVRADLTQIIGFESPYQLPQDTESRANRLVYVETSRGCPYQCGYCLSSLEKGIRYYPDKYVEDNLQYLITNGAKQLKFLDRTFNIHPDRTRRIFDFLLANYRSNLSCQFEVYAELLNNDLIDYLNQHLPPHFFRFEIGIQSTHEPTNIAVKRMQDFDLLAANIRRLMSGGKIDLHLDLIAGLPYETYDRFVQSFNDVFQLGAKEVQLGFLKMLRGTSLRKNAGEYGYVYTTNAPYEICYNSYITSQELERIHEAEHALERYWNSGRFPSSMHVLIYQHYIGRYFELFDELAHHCRKQGLPANGYQLEDLFKLLHDFAQLKRIDLFAELRNDYYQNFTQRPHGFWKDTLDKKQRKKLLYEIGQDKNFLKTHHLTRKIIEKQTAIDPLTETTFLLTVFLRQKDSERLSIVYELPIE